LSSVEETTSKYFDATVTDRERAVFEGAITLGSIYHQFTGTPISPEKKAVKALERAIEKTMALQPYKTHVRIRIDTRKIAKYVKKSRFGYTTLKGEYLDAQVTARYGKARATLRMRYVPELNYNLMYVESISNVALNKRRVGH